MLDVHIPDGALRPEAEAALVERLTEILIRHEGFDPTDPAARAVSWVFVHHPTVYVAGRPADTPRYKVVPSVPEGQLDAAGRAGVVREVTEAVLAAEQGRWPRDPNRVWVFPTEIPDGHWGGGGEIRPLAAILTRLIDDERMRRPSSRRSGSTAAARNGPSRRWPPAAW